MPFQRPHRILRGQPDRRKLLKWLALTSCTAALPAFAEGNTPSFSAQQVPGSAAQLIIGGGPTSVCGAIAPLLLSILTQSLTEKDLPIVTHQDMGFDGVTAANIFDTIGLEDGKGAAILTPGTALIASLSGDERVHFDYSRWIAMLVAQRPVMTVARADLNHTLRARLHGLVSNKSLTLAVSQVTGVELTSLLGLELLGLRPMPLTGFGTQESALKALREGRVDAAQLSPTPSKTVSSLIAELPSGVKPLFYSGPSIPGVPSLQEASILAVGHLPSGPLFKGWCAVANAAATAFILALPMLSPSLTVARWRHAAKQTQRNDAFKQWSADHQLNISAGTDASPLLNQLTPELTALLALRRWMSIKEPKWRHEQRDNLK